MAELQEKQAIKNKQTNKKTFQEEQSVQICLLFLTPRYEKNSEFLGILFLWS